MASQKVTLARANSSENNMSAIIREAGTSAGNYDLDTDAIVERLTAWQSLCTFRIPSAGRDRVEIEFDTLPEDMEAFAKELYDFCPDLVEQGTGCIAELVESGEDLSPKMQKLIEGVDFNDENYGLEILKREVEQTKRIALWWD